MTESVILPANISTENDDLRNLITHMSLEENVGQLIQIGFYGIEVTDELREMITRYKVGNIILFARNIKSLDQIARLTNDLQQIAIGETKIPLTIAIDQEGGTVTRINGATHFPGHMALGASGDVDTAYRIGQMTAKELRALGINMNLAPILDVGIDSRIFSSDPQLVSMLGSAYARGLQDEGVIACGKHFPGHGHVTDSHLTFPISLRSAKKLTRVDLRPFQEAIKSGIDCFMTAHIYCPFLAKEFVSATLSKRVLIDLLRNKMGFNGVILTDNLEMWGGLPTHPVDAAIKTICAGADMFMMCHVPDYQRAALEKIIDEIKKNGEISEERLHQSVYRILKLKQSRIGLTGTPACNLDYFSHNSDVKAAYEVAKKVVTLIKDKNKLIPISDPFTKKFLVIDFVMRSEAITEVDKEYDQPLPEILNEKGIKTEYCRIPGPVYTFPDISKFDLVIVVTYNVMNHPEQIDIVKKLHKMKCPFIVLAVRNAGDILYFPRISTYLTTYDYSPGCFKAFVDVILGKGKALGKLPIKKRELKYLLQPKIDVNKIRELLAKDSGADFIEQSGK